MSPSLEVGGHAWQRIEELDQLAGVHRDPVDLDDAQYDECPDEREDVNVALERRRQQWRDSKRKAAP